MSNTFTLFETSWEVCNKVGGIHTVISTKAKTMVERFGDDYVTIGPWLLSDTERELPFEDDPAFARFAESCREMGIPVRVGRWTIPGRPLTILVEFSRLYEEKDDILSELWEDYGVDSISGTWDYVEPVLFGYAVGRVVERWWEEFLAPEHRRAVLHSHEWMTGSSLLYLKRVIPAIGTVFTTHATMLGRALSAMGHSPEDGLGEQTPTQLAETHGVQAKHSIEGVCAREADAFTTVSEITAQEALLLHERMAEPILPNGIDLEVVDELAGSTQRQEARTLLQQTASRFFGEEIGDAAFFCVSGRYEFHNKGIDLLLDAALELNQREGRRVVLFVLVPAGNSGVRSEFLDRQKQGLAQIDGPMGFSTHNLFDEDEDPVHKHLRQRGFENSPDTRVKVIQIPIYLGPGDDLLGLPYEAVLRAMDLSCFPSYYEPWGYTPQESLAVGVPTITSDYAGFGRWANGAALTPDNGITVLERVHVEYPSVLESLVEVLEDFLKADGSAREWEAICRETARLTSWEDLSTNYHQAYTLALDSVQTRLEEGVPQSRRPRRSVVIQADHEGEQPKLRSFDVAATLPEQLAGLTRLTRNYWWSWDPVGSRLFQELSPIAWEAHHHNPVLALKRAYPEDLEERAQDAPFVKRLKDVLGRFDEYLKEAPQESEGLTAESPVAYFCAEFGIHESLRIYSGGLGVLAGDHLKSASDLNIPLVAVGIFYRFGYLTQRISSNGDQIPLDIENDPRSLPMEPVLDANSHPLEVSIPLPGRNLFLRAWRVQVGRVTLFLLDANTPSNQEDDRDITKNLYGGDQETRLQQEIVLGRGGVRLLRALEIQPSVFHMNEGHAAFLTLERVGQLMRKEGLPFEEAREYVRATSLFTTHTPVPAGHDRFGEDLMRRYFSDVPDSVGVPWEKFWSFGHAGEGDGTFNMTYLAIHFASYVNGVSQLHGTASRQLLHPLWPGLLESETPVGSVTNGIHLGTWTAPEIAAVLGVKDRPIRGQDFAKKLTAKALAEVWKARQGLKRLLLERIRVSTKRAFVERSDNPSLLTRTLDGLDDNALLIGFARRFAPYKRANLIFQDVDRLRAILDSTDRPVRLLIAGKAHPRDEHGKDLLRGIVEVSRQEEFMGRVFFLEDYDMDLARYLVQGVDIWLNNPTRMLEASGTSGMKAAANGVLNLSIADGWWPEAYDGQNGWVIADARTYSDQELQNQLDGGALYRLLEDEVLPKFFTRDKDGVPTRWMAMVRECLRTIPPAFNTDRMVGDYLEQAYARLSKNPARLGGDNRPALRSLVQERHRIKRGFADVRIQSIEVGELSGIRVGDPLDVRVEVELGSLQPEDVVVELVVGHSNRSGDLDRRKTVPLERSRSSSSSPYVFEGSHETDRSGTFAYGVRVRPNPEQTGGSLDNLVLWA